MHKNLLLASSFVISCLTVETALAAPPPSVAAPIAAPTTDTVRAAQVPNAALLPRLQLPEIASTRFLPMGWTPPHLMQSSVSTSEPSSGLGLIIAGWILTGVGVLNLVTLPVCYADFYQNYADGDVCVAGSVVVGTIGLGLGIPFLIVGYNNRAKHKRWESQQTVSLWKRARIVPLHGGATASFTLPF